jgi:hypothetical protein
LIVDPHRTAVESDIITTMISTPGDEIYSLSNFCSMSFIGGWIATIFANKSFLTTKLNNNFACGCFVSLGIPFVQIDDEIVKKGCF